jgi:archaetidylinositol phosphate synthase
MAGTLNPKSSSHRRDHRSLLADAERRLLQRIAVWLPRRVNSDHLSCLGLLSMFAAGISFAAFRFTPWAAFAVVVSLALNWFGDSLDGTVARVRGHERPRYGYYVDHVIDLAGTTALLAGLGASGLMTPMWALAVLAAYLLVSAETYLATHAAGVFRMAVLGFGPTELRILLAIGALKASRTPFVSIAGVESLRLFDVGAVVATVALIGVFVAAAIGNTKQLYAAEPIPSAHGKSRGIESAA